jgi:hypothetical protein
MLVAMVQPQHGDIVGGQFNPLKASKIDAFSDVNRNTKVATGEKDTSSMIA